MEQFLAGFEALKANIFDNMIEQQAKLGYRKEPVRLYYPLSSLNHFFNKKADSDEMQQILSVFRFIQKNNVEKFLPHIKENAFVLPSPKRFRNMFTQINPAIFLFVN